jgi:hypothetical protein
MLVAVVVERKEEPLEPEDQAEVEMEQTQVQPLQMAL